MKMRMDHSGAEPVLVVDRGYGEERVSLSEYRRLVAELLDGLAAGTDDVRLIVHAERYFEDACTGTEFVHTLITGGLAPG